jgi:exopolyphosphatase / guanosine-5'-triphosphate,3'-diphosphate pyrophosphatase
MGPSRVARLETQPAGRDAGSGRISYPVRVGAIDVGSNAIRFSAVEFTSRTAKQELERLRAPVRLGHEVFRTGRLAAGAVEAALEALGGFARRMESLDVGPYRAVATSAVRDSEDGVAFVRRARAEAGIQLETITGSEEARLVWLAVRDRFTLGAGPWLIMDLGGGSVELSLAKGAKPAWTVSHTMGAVRLLEVFESAGDGSEFKELLEEYIGTLRLEAPGLRVKARVRGLIATGGNIEALADLGRGRRGTDGAERLGLAELRRLIGQMGKLSAAQRMERWNLRPDRADVILPAALLYERVARMAGVKEIVVPRVGVKDGVLLDVLDEIAARSRHRRRHDQEAFEGAVGLGRRFDFDEPHARHVAMLAMSLFDQLQPLHHLSESDRRILAAAALLHDVGQFVSYHGHHKHSFYLVAHSELAGFSPRQMPIIGLVARYHRKAEPRPEHPGFAELDAADRERVHKLAALLRVADALDREHVQRVTGVDAIIEDDGVELRVVGSGALESWSMPAKAALFERTFGVPLRVEEG